MMWAMQVFVELVEFHEHTLVILVEMEGTFHIFESLFLTVLFVEPSEGEVSPYGGVVGVKFGREFPILDGKVILTGGIV